MKQHTKSARDARPDGAGGKFVLARNLRPVAPGNDRRTLRHNRKKPVKAVSQAVRDHLFAAIRRAFSEGALWRIEVPGPSR